MNPEDDAYRGEILSSFSGQLIVMRLLYPYTSKCRRHILLKNPFENAIILASEKQIDFSVDTSLKKFIELGVISGFVNGDFMMKKDHTL